MLNSDLRKRRKCSSCFPVFISPNVCSKVKIGASSFAATGPGMYSACLFSSSFFPSTVLWACQHCENEGSLRALLTEPGSKAGTGKKSAQYPHHTPGGSHFRRSLGHPVELRQRRGS